MRVNRQTDHVFMVNLTADEIERLRQLEIGYNLSLESALHAMIEVNLQESDKTDSESEDAHELEGKNEGIRRG